LGHHRRRDPDRSTQARLRTPRPRLAARSPRENGSDPMTEAIAQLTGRLRRTRRDESEVVLRYVQPGLVGLIDGTLSTLAPIFAAALLAGSRSALFVGLATALGAGISMGFSEALSDDGTQTGRGSAL